MSSQIAVRIAGDPRRSARTLYSGKATYRYARGEGGGATVVNLCAIGACPALGRYLRPGRFILVGLETDSWPRGTIELKAQIVWCRPTDNPGAFLMGVRIFQDDPDTGAVMSDLLLRSRAGEAVAHPQPAPLWHLNGENAIRATGTPGKVEPDMLRLNSVGSRCMPNAQCLGNPGWSSGGEGAEARSCHPACA
jgi:hypothetical protein